MNSFRYMKHLKYFTFEPCNVIITPSMPITLTFITLRNKLLDAPIVTNDKSPIRISNNRTSYFFSFLNILRRILPTQTTDSIKNFMIRNGPCQILFVAPNQLKLLLNITGFEIEVGDPCIIRLTFPIPNVFRCIS